MYEEGEDSLVTDKWTTFHLYHDAVRLTNYKLRITNDDKQTTVYKAKCREYAVFSGKPYVELRRADDTFVGASKFRLTWFSGSRMDIYQDAACRNLETTIQHDYGFFSGKYNFKLRGMNVMWKRTNNNGGSAWGDNYKLIDDVGRIIAIYQDVVLSLKKDGRIQIKEDLDPETVDLIVLTAVSLAHKKKQDN